MSAIPVDMPRKLIDIEIDGETVRVPEGATILDACRATASTRRRCATPTT